MTVAILLLACMLLAGAVVALAVALRGVRERVQVLERSAVRSPGFETGASAPSSTSGGAGARSSTGGGAGASSTRDPFENDRPSPRGHDDEDREYVITRVGNEAEAEPAPTVESKLFADIVLRESVVKAASWAYAVRRGLSPANRNRIRFEMRREVKRVRKNRKAEEREAIRQYRARRRAAVRDQPSEMNVA
jgi:hypothetical protein